MLPSDRVLGTFYRLSTCIYYVSICSGLAAIFNDKFRAISGYISETARDRVKVATNHYNRKSHKPSDKFSDNQCGRLS